MTDTKTTRRAFLGTAAAATAAAGTIAASPAESGEVRWIDALPKKWDETYDIVIIGSGFAGLAAAYEARRAGATVAILDKMRAPGGNSIINGGIIAAAGSPLQDKQGIKDNWQQLEEDMVREGLGLNHPELVRLVAEQSWPTVKWTIEEFGVQYTERIVHEGGHKVPRCYSTHNNSGSAIVNPMLAKIKEIGQEIKLQTYVEQILRDKDGRVKGLMVREGYAFPREGSGKQKFIRAKKAVILAHGGFGQDVKFRMKQDPKLTDKFDTTNHPGATSEMLRESLRIGAIPVQLSWIQVVPWCSPDEKGMGIGVFFAQGAAAMHGVWINASTGKRFIDELANRKIRADAIMNLMNKGDVCLAIADSHNIDPSRQKLQQTMVDRGIVKAFDSYEEIAAAHKIPLDALKKTIEDHDRFLAQGKDEELGRYMNKLSKPMNSKPIYVMRLQPKIHYTMGGIDIDTGAHVLDVTTDKPIPGLYAAGESVGGVHGAVRLGSCSSLACLVLGRIAAKNAVAEKAWA